MGCAALTDPASSGALACDSLWLFDYSMTALFFVIYTILEFAFVNFLSRIETRVQKELEAQQRGSDTDVHSVIPTINTLRKAAKAAKASTAQAAKEAGVNVAIVRRAEEALLTFLETGKAPSLDAKARAEAERQCKQSTMRASTALSNAAARGAAAKEAAAAQLPAEKSTKRASISLFGLEVTLDGFEVTVGGLERRSGTAKP